MKRGMTIEYLKRRADFKFEVDFGVDLNYAVFIHNTILLNTYPVRLIANVKSLNFAFKLYLSSVRKDYSRRFVLILIKYY